MLRASGDGCGIVLGRGGRRRDMSDSAVDSVAVVAGEKRVVVDIDAKRAVEC